MEARKVIVCALPAVKPQDKPEQPQQEAVNTTPPQRGQSSGGNRAEFRSYQLTRLDETEEDIDPDFLPYFRAMGAYDSAPPQRGQFSGGNDVHEITRAEFRSSQLIRIEEPEENIDPDYLHYLRAIGAYDSAPPQHRRSSGGGNGRRNSQSRRSRD